MSTLWNQTDLKWKWIQTNFSAFSMKRRIKVHSWNSSSNLHKCIQLGRIGNLYLWELICIVIIALLKHLSTSFQAPPIPNTFIFFELCFLCIEQFLFVLGQGYHSINFIRILVLLWKYSDTFVNFYLELCDAINRIWNGRCPC